MFLSLVIKKEFQKKHTIWELYFEGEIISYLINLMIKLSSYQKCEKKNISITNRVIIRLICLKGNYCSKNRTFQSKSFV